VPRPPGEQQRQRRNAASPNAELTVQQFAARMVG